VCYDLPPFLRMFRRTLSPFAAVPVLFALSLALALSPAPWARAAAGADLFGRTVSHIGVTGNRQIESTTIRGTLTTREGEPLSAEAVRKDVKAIYALGFFDDVVVDAEPAASGGGVDVTYRVTELPILTGYTFHGNQKVLEESLKEAVSGLNDGAFLQPQVVLKVRQALLEKYEKEGYRRASVVPVTEITVGGDGQRSAALTFVIEEGEKTKIRKIAFEGNTAFPDSVLRGKLKTKERFWLTSWLTDSGIFRESDVAEDLVRLDEFYQDQGYYDVRADEPRLDVSEDKRWLTLTYPVHEGVPYDFGEVDYNDHGKVPEDELTADLKVRRGERYSRSLIRQDVGTLTDRLGEHGYAFAQVAPDLVPHPDLGLVDTTFNVQEGDQVRIRRINISGNTKTRDKVIRREVRQQEGEIINTSLLRRSFQRINNLNYFETVDIVPVNAGPGLLDLDVKVKEKSTGQFSIGGGFSSVDGLVGIVELTQGNLGGRGQTLSGHFERSGRRTVYDLRFKEPSLWDTLYSGGFDVFKIVRDFTSYEEHRTGAGLTVGRAIGEYLNVSMGYTLENVDIRVLDSSVPASIKQQKGRSTTSSVSLTVSRDTRDNFFDPRRGTRNVVRLEYAGGPLRGENDFLKGTLDQSVYFPTFAASALTFRNLLGVGRGLTGNQLPAGERFFVGGISTVRGYDFGDAGPLAGDSGDPVGGNKEWVMTAEMVFPLVKAANLKGALFMDWGAGFDNGQSIAYHDLNRTWGYEIRWISPLGPLRFGYGWVLNDKRPLLFRDGGKQFFTIGTFF
jgi:outer membrane protein insertion porin family